MGYCFSWGAGNFGIFGWLVPILFWSLIIFGSIYLGKRLIQNNNYQNDKDRPLEILKREYVKGEISQEEFLKRKQTLQEE